MEYRVNYYTDCEFISCTFHSDINQAVAHGKRLLKAKITSLILENSNIKDEDLANHIEEYEMKNIKYDVTMLQGNTVIGMSQDNDRLNFLIEVMPND